MKGDKWCIVEDGYDFRIQFYNADVDDMGAYFGDGTNKDGTWPEKADDDEFWNKGHNEAVRMVNSKGLGERDRTGMGGGFKFQSRSAATAALGILKACHKQAESDKPWPAWAKEALAAGWKAPKGWTP